MATTTLAPIPVDTETKPTDIPVPPAPPLSPAQERSRSDVRSNVIFTVAVFLLLALAYKLLKELEIIYVSALFAVVLMPIVGSITKLKIGKFQPSRPVAIVLLLATVVLALGLFFLLGLPPVIRDIESFSKDFPQKLPGIVEHAKRLPLANRVNIDDLAKKTEGAATATASYLVASLPLWLAHIFDILTALFLCIYFMLEGEHAYEFFLSLFQPDHRARLDATLKKAEAKMSKWLIGQGLLMGILGGCSVVVFGFLHVRYFFLLGLLMGLMNIIPIAGAVVTVLLSAGVAALDSWPKMAGVLIFYLIYVNLENAVLTPRIMKSSVDLMGLTVLVALLIGTALAGVVGALVAVPTAALISVLLDEYAVQRA